MERVRERMRARRVALAATSCKRLLLASLSVKQHLGTAGSWVTEPGIG